MEALDSPSRITELRTTIATKPLLNDFYRGIYAGYAASLAACLGGRPYCGARFGRWLRTQVIPQLITTDVLPYDGVDRVVDATRMPFKDRSVRFFGMLNAASPSSGTCTTSPSAPMPRTGASTPPAR
jgi:hypothetical protein